VHRLASPQPLVTYFPRFICPPFQIPLLRLFFPFLLLFVRWVDNDIFFSSARESNSHPYLSFIVLLSVPVSYFSPTPGPPGRFPPDPPIRLVSLPFLLEFWDFAASLGRVFLSYPSGFCFFSALTVTFAHSISVATLALSRLAPLVSFARFPRCRFVLIPGVPFAPLLLFELIILVTLDEVWSC